MSEKDIIPSSPQPVSEPTSKVVPITRARSYKIDLKPSSPDYSQYIRVVKNYALVGMPFEHIAHVAEELGDEVEIRETTAPIRDGWQSKVGEVVEEEGRIIAWQDKGEISITPQLTAPNTATGQKIVATQGLTNPQKQTLKVLEGVGVYKQSAQPPNNLVQFPTPQTLHDANLVSNPYLQPLPQQKKAA
ncbi:hypothetical protein HY384_02405 [Candidatus Daviesbacteria bacterium]|nr:hypothetical protein [Candidatus Daviesbacteria bacterium]